MVISTATNTIVIVGGFGTASSNGGRHRILHYCGETGGEVRILS